MSRDQIDIHPLDHVLDARAATARSAELRSTDPYIPPYTPGNKQFTHHEPALIKITNLYGLKAMRIGSHDLPVPARQTDGAAGYDLQLCGEPFGDQNAGVVIQAGGRMMVRTGFAWSIPDGWAGMICPRSGLANKSGLDKLAGLIDFDYTGEVRVILINHGDTPVNFSHGDRIAQMVIIPCMTEEVELVESLDDTDRGEGGFGHTGGVA